MSVPKQPFGSRTPYYGLSSSYTCEKAALWLLMEDGRIQRKASRAVLSGGVAPFGKKRICRQGFGARKHQRLAGPAAFSLRWTLEESARWCLVTAIRPYGLVG